MERNSAPPAFETAAPSEALCPRYFLGLEEEEESLLRPQAAAAIAGVEVHWDEASLDAEGWPRARIIRN